MTELTDERKAEIALEEIYRARIQPLKANTLTKGMDDVGQRIWKFFNSNLGIWLLSSVVFSSLATFLQHRHLDAAQHATYLLQVETTKFSVSDRVEELRFFLRNAKTNAEVAKALETLFKSSYPNPGPTGGSSIYSLVYAIYPLLANPHDLVIRDALETIRSIEHKYVEVIALETNQTSPTATKQFIYAQLDHLQSLQLMPSKLKE